ncbi:hypothetical protein QVD17_00445 [Tagetes erecta]|uniref:Uncharacterized protein n=1 Tax=Tagetes erecta TaxID=13708 RepID=A0AAD8L8N1_TARER|nr:hypothetical protein QVD17_00445 [Tagetes erecta]
MNKKKKNKEDVGRTKMLPNSLLNKRLTTLVSHDMMTEEIREKFFTRWKEFRISQSKEFTCEAGFFRAL